MSKPVEIHLIQKARGGSKVRLRRFRNHATQENPLRKKVDLSAF